MLRKRSGPSRDGNPGLRPDPTHEVVMRQAVRRVARAALTVTIIIFDIITAFAALLLVLIWGGTL